DGLDGLRIGVARAHDLTLRIRGRCARDMNHVANSHCARIANYGLPLGAGRNVLTAHAYKSPSSLEYAQGKTSRGPLASRHVKGQDQCVSRFEWVDNRIDPAA